MSVIYIYSYAEISYLQFTHLNLTKSVFILHMPKNE